MSKLVKYKGREDSQLDQDRIYTVERELEDEYILSGIPGIHLKQWFEPYVIQGKHSEILEVISALRVIDKWNRTHPSSMMISVEAGIVQDGGSQFIMHDYDTHDVDEFFKRLLERSDTNTKQAVINHLLETLKS